MKEKELEVTEAILVLSTGEELTLTN